MPNIYLMGVIRKYSFTRGENVNQTAKLNKVPNDEEL